MESRRLMAFAAMCMAMAPFGSSAACDEARRDQFALQREEFAKYYRQITGTDAPDGIVKFVIDHKGGVGNMFYDNPELSRTTIIEVKSVPATMK